MGKHWKKFALLAAGTTLFICPYTVGCGVISALAAIWQVTGGLPLVAL